MGRWVTSFSHSHTKHNTIGSTKAFRVIGSVGSVWSGQTYHRYIHTIYIGRESTSSTTGAKGIFISREGVKGQQGIESKSLNLDWEVLGEKFGIRWRGDRVGLWGVT